MFFLSVCDEENGVGPIGPSIQTSVSLWGGTITVRCTLIFLGPTQVKGRWFVHWSLSNNWEMF